MEHKIFETFEIYSKFTTDNSSEQIVTTRSCQVITTMM